MVYNVAKVSDWKNCGYKTPCPNLWKKSDLSFGTTTGDKVADGIAYGFVGVLASFGLVEAAVSGAISEGLTSITTQITQDKLNLLFTFIQTLVDCPDCNDVGDFSARFATNYAINFAAGKVIGAALETTAAQKVGAWMFAKYLAAKTTISSSTSKILSKGLAQIAQAKNKVNSYIDNVWAKVESWLGSATSLTFNSLLRTNLTKIGVSINPLDYALASGSRAGAIVGRGVNIETKEIIFADQIFDIIGKKCIFPKTGLRSIEGFLDDGIPFTMKEVESGDLTTIVPNINEMYLNLLRPDEPIFWTGVEGYLKVGFDSFIYTGGPLKGQSVIVTQQLIEKEFSKGIGLGSLKIKNDGILSKIRVFLKNGDSFLLDLTKLKQ
ncbi:MAG: hypothetical protein ACK4YV_00385 [Emticicia sp.]